jgi:protein phosphatase
MENTVVKIQCSNPQCKAFNSLERQTCENCNTPLLKRYLWVLGEEIDRYPIGTSIGERYLVKQKRVLLDTQPSKLPQMPEEIPDSIIAYLKLLPCRPHIPQIYGQLTPDPNLPENSVWLLEFGTVPLNNQGELQYSQLLPEIPQIWSEQQALRQLNWLWQIANLWEHLQAKEVVSSLLDSSLLRANGPLLQLLELKSDRQPHTLQDLGKFWSEALPKTSPKIQEFYQELCLNLKQEKIATPERLISILDQALRECAKHQNYTYQIYSLSDSGPTRDHNEDNCYPPSGQLLEIQPPDKPLAIVCDGIGGHEGGEIASQEAIDYLREEVNNLYVEVNKWNPNFIKQELETFTCAANDRISFRNDSEKRHERRRMGTTLVMALGHDHEMYLTHVGDSRIYLISGTGCHQMTVDDDLASREVRLGYALYRDASQYPSAGALVQALGMSSSYSLHPTIRRSIVDEDCIFLLCSDGLSDFDRVEQYWQQKILPTIQQKMPLVVSGKELIDLANQKNGHDNVTITLLYCQVSPKSDLDPQSKITLPKIKAHAPTVSEPLLEQDNNLATPSPTANVSNMPTVPSNLESNDSKSIGRSLLPIAAISILLLGILGAFLYEPIRKEASKLIDSAISLFSSGSSSSNNNKDTSATPPTIPFKQDDIFKIKQTLQVEGLDGKSLEIPENTIVKVIELPNGENPTAAIELQLCDLPSDVEEVPPFNRNEILLLRYSREIALGKTEATTEEKSKCQSLPTVEPPTNSTSPAPLTP